MSEDARAPIVVSVLGRPLIVGPDGPHTVRGQRSIDLLSLLVANRGRPVRRDTIEDELWDGVAVDPTAVRVNVGRLRRRFTETVGIDPIVSSAGAYALDLSEDQVDADRLRASLRTARRAWSTGAVGSALEIARAGVELWRGPAFEGTHDLSSLAPERSLLGDTRRDLVDLLAACLLTEGKPADAFERAAENTSDDPYREGSWALRIAALHVQGRTADALRDHDRVTRMLCVDLGIAPATLLLDLREALLHRAPPEEVVTLVCPAAPSRQARGARTGPPERPEPTGPDLVGRRAETDVADAMISDGSPRLWVLDGPPGVGKTRMGAETRARATDAGLTVATGTCPRGVGVGQVALRQIVGDLLPALPDDVLADPSVGGVLGSVFPELVEGQEAVPGPDSSDTTLAETRLFRALERVIASSPPAIVVVDDIQWIDPPLANVLSVLSTSAEHVRWMFLTRTADRGAAATDLIADLARAGARLDTLQPLTIADAAELVRRTAPDLSDDTVHVAVDRASGSPFVLIELARHAAGSGDLDAVPANVNAVIAAELARLDDDAVAVAEVIAVAGDPRPIGAVTAAAGLQGRRASAAIGTLEAHGLAATDPGRTEIAPGHDLVRAAIRDRMTAPDVETVHHRLADALASVEAAPVLRLAHLLAAGDVGAAEAEAAAVEALDDPAIFSAPHQVAELSRTLIPAIGPIGTDAAGIELRLVIASALFGVGDAAGGRRLITLQQSALDSLDDPVLEALAHLTQVSVVLQAVDSTDQRRRAEAVLERLPADRPTLRARLACWIGHAASAEDDGKARAMADRAEELLGDLDEPKIRAEILTLRLASSLSLEAPPGESDRILAQLEGGMARLPGGETVLGPARLERALRTGRIDDLARAVERLERERTAGHWAVTRWWSFATRATIDLARGDLVAAERSVDEAMAYGAKQAVELTMPAAMLQRFVLDWETGRFGRYHALLPSPEQDATPALAFARVFACIAVGDDRGARGTADLLARPELMTSRPGAGAWPTTVSLAAHAAWILGHAALGEIVLDALEDRPDAGLGVVGLCYLGSIGLARGLARAATGRTDAAIDDLHAALDRETWFGGPIWIARAATAAAGLHEHRDGPGDRDEAARLRRRAEEARATMTWPEDTVTPTPTPG